MFRLVNERMGRGLGGRKGQRYPACILKATGVVGRILLAGYCWQDIVGRILLAEYCCQDIVGRIMCAKECNVLANLSPADYKAIRKLIIDLIMCTDLAVHFEVITQAVSVFYLNNESLFSPSYTTVQPFYQLEERLHVASPGIV